MRYFTIEFIAMKNNLLILLLLWVNSATLCATNITVKDSIAVSDTVLLNEVQVLGKKKAFKWEKNTLVANIQDSDLKNELTVNDVLRRLPGLWYQNGQITIPGKKSPVYYINERKVTLMSEIEALSVHNIKEIQVMTVPNSYYDSDGAPVILITTKRIADAVNVESNSHLSYYEQWNGTENVSSMLQKGEMTFYFLYKYGSNYAQNDSKGTQYNMFNDTIWKISSQNKNRGRTRTHHYQFGMDYQKNNLIVGLKYNGLYGKGNNKASSMKNVTNDRNEGSFSLDSRQNQVSPSQYHHLNLFVSKGLGDKWRLKNSMDYLNRKNEGGTDVSEESSGIQSNLDYTSLNKWNIFSDQLSLIYRITDNHTLSVGANVSYSKGNNNVRYSDNSYNGYSQTTENKWRAFLSYEGSCGNLNWNANLSYDWLHTVSKNLAGDILKKENIPNIYPSLSLSYMTQKGQMHILNYGISISRPQYSDLNNEVQYLNRFAYKQGNLYLKNSVEHALGYIFYWGDFFANLTYAYTHRPLMDYATPYALHPYATLYQTINEPHYHTLILNANYKHSFKYWEPSIGFLLYKCFYSYQTAEGNAHTRTPFLSFSFSNIFKLPFKIRLTVDYQQYLKGELYNIKGRPYSFVNLSLQRSFLKDKLQCALRVNDLFKKQIIRGDIFYHNIHANSVSQSNTRGLSLNIIYRFNHSLKRKYKGESSAEEEMQRLNYTEE